MSVTILPVDKDLLDYISKRGLTKKFQKQLKFLSENPKHPSLNIELLNPKERAIYSFRIDRKFRALFFFVSEENAIKIFDANDHYQ